MDKNWTRGMAQAVKYVLCNPEALSSSPSATKKKKKKEYMLTMQHGMEERTVVPF
jgi:hypothetical protein